LGQVSLAFVPPLFVYLLPASDVIQSSALSLWEYRWYVVGVTIASFVEALLIAALLILHTRRRKAEHEGERFARLAQSEHRHLNEVVSNVPGIVFETLIDPLTNQRQTTFISDQVEKMLGYTVDEWLATPGFGLRIMPDEEDRERAKRDSEEVIRSGKEGTSTFRWKTKDGRILWVETNLAAIVDEQGKTIGLRGVILDITERKAAEEALRQSEERFKKAFTANPQPMSLTTLAGGVYLDVNEAFLTMSGYSREEVIGHSSYELKIWETPEARHAFIEQLKDRDSIVNVETRFRTKDGSLRVLLSSAEELELAGEVCLLMASSDITESVAAQQALRESEARFRNMADTAPIMIWMADQDKHFTYFNEQWLAFTGQGSEGKLDSRWMKGIHPDDHERCLEVYGASFDAHKAFEMEYRMLRADGQYRWVFDVGRPRFSSQGDFLGFIGSCIDITERKELEVSLHSALEELNQFKNQLEAENIYLQHELQLDQSFDEIIGQSDATKYVLAKINQVAPTDSTVLITGETGTGKELVARAIHGASLRKGRPLIKVNCAALAASLIESELFGHEKGAFTGAGARKLGRFEVADRGTLFLDEIGELPLELQVKLLRVLQEGEFDRLGGTKTIKVDVRIIAATNRNLKLEVEKGTFREDLWYRLNVFPITVPPLRQRKEDIPLLVEHFVATYGGKFGKTITSVSPRTLQSLQAHSWPGNVRELAHVIERAVIHTQGSVLHLADIFEQVPEEPTSALSLEEMEREYIIRTLENTGWRVEGPQGAAKILGLNPSTLRARMFKLGIQRPRAMSV
jgi:PAS domain S-box-containing protein